MRVVDDEIRRFGRLLHYAGVLAAVVCATVGYSLVHAPAVRGIAETSARIDELLQSVSNGPIMRAQHRIVSEKLRDVTSRIASVQRRVPREPNPGEFLKEVTQLASAGHLAIEDFHPDKPMIKAGYGEMQVKLKGEGSFGSICTFVDRLAKLTRLSKIQDLTLSAEGNETDYPMTATLVIYFGLRGNDKAPPRERRSG
ncbi:MAG TPA: type 4a pilus biogenesis protein PilO [Lacipirellulaceae bacterium]|nr:type 4a pilus biogenesis protein PilO [Lacipirellulaceae bacterium]